MYFRVALLPTLSTQQGQATRNTGRLNVPTGGNRDLGASKNIVSIGRCGAVSARFRSDSVARTGE